MTTMQEGKHYYCKVNTEYVLNNPHEKISMLSFCCLIEQQNLAITETLQITASKK